METYCSMADQELENLKRATCRNERAEGLLRVSKVNAFLVGG